MIHVGLLCVLTMALTPWGRAEGEVHFQDLLSPGESRQYRSKPQYRARMGVLRKALERHGEKTRREVRTRRFSNAVETLAAIRVIARHGMELTESSAEARDFRSKKVRKLEIRLRKMTEMLEDLKSAPPFEYRSSFEETVGLLSDFRRQLLEGYFDDPGESRDSATRSPALTPLQFSVSQLHAAPAASPYRQRKLRSTVGGDQFTEEEEDAIREAQELKPRVKVLLRIAESRLDEIARRLAQHPWKEKEPNPLEFFTYAQMVRAYHRALRVLMINVDEKARFGTASEKDIRKSLELVNKQMQTFIPQLQPLRKLAIELQDEDLFVEVRQAQKISEQALKGSQLGLGAPSQ